MVFSLVTRTSSRWNAIASSDINKLHTDCLFETDNKYGFPEVRSSVFDYMEDLIGFNECKKPKEQDKKKTVHFFLDDYQFERLWTKPNRYINTIRNYNGMISPTFSVWSNQPYALNLFNIYRSRWITRYFQEMCEIKVLVDVRWADESSYDYCFSGIERNCPVILNAVGTRQLDNRRLFRDGFEEMLRQLEPSMLYVHGEFNPVDFEKYVDRVVYFKSYWAKKREQIEC